jgi:medium-chain acyl-[acyl-carrier-protein] hydrolase
MDVRGASAEPVWREELRVRAYEVGADGWATPLALANWMQEAAGNHATALGWAVDQLAPKGLTWVLSRLHVRVDGYPRWRESVTVETWPAGVERLYALREFRVKVDGDRPCAFGTSGWLLLNVASRRPVRPPQAISDIAAACPGRVLDDGFPKLPEPARADAQRAFDARFFEIDLNRHVNNVAVIAWLLEAVPDDLLQRGSLAALELEFRAEAQAGDEVVAEIERGGDCVCLHRVVRRSDGREVARARTTWRAP